MGPQLFPPLDALEQKLSWMRALADSLARAQSAVLRSDIAEVARQTVQQQQLCQQLAQCKIGPSEFAADGERWFTLRDELHGIEGRVLNLNREYGALLRRANRTVGIFCRVLASSEITYAPPKPAPVAHQESRE